ncbi:molybdenum cofactor cytidylyltransferase [Sphingomonas laterariae]|uniref:Molybdenum cofactor cytidylyltransferase n=1 Tax=Edaphosphingomonas laterariae TaxID=861865 RepID=A0A239H0P2_9SPHN|nr:nucleotidyltransferase family protein [Sphingomonas laterariae]SNS74363.1 molybdenum cofactor cytidylyltransferase [Sphingomonas laterariae]
MIVGGIVLAAGRSSRMGGNKLVADYAGKPLVAHAVDAVADALGRAPLVVTGHARAAVEGALAGRCVEFTFAQHFAEGMSRSLAAGIAAVPRDWDAAIICLGDMPLIAPGLIRALAARAAWDAIVLPVRDGRRGHPVAWGRDFFAELTLIDGDIGGKALLAKFGNAITELAWADDTIFVDVDTPATLADLRDRL